MSQPKPRASNTLPQVVAYWREHWEDVFPDLTAALYSWNEPFCFRCGWLAPVRPSRGAWSRIGGWLERAHLQDFSGGGADEPSNIVPLCMLCHRGMPEFPDSRDAAVAWVKAQGHRCRHRGWQLFTNAVWTGVRSPGRMVFVNSYVRWTERYSLAATAVDYLAAGRRDKAFECLRLADIPAAEAQKTIDRYRLDRTLEAAA